MLNPTVELIAAVVHRPPPRNPSVVIVVAARADKFMSNKLVTKNPKNNMNLKNSINSYYLAKVIINRKIIPDVSIKSRLPHWICVRDISPYNE